MNATAAHDPEEATDAESAQLLKDGSGLLQSGNAAGAREPLERALRLRPDSQRGQNLLALCYFRLGLFDRAEELYGGLAAENPGDATLRVNLGLVCLKTNRVDEAVETFRAALELSPSHAKAQNYLALAYLQKKDLAAAKEWFDKAGNAAMSAKVAAMLGAGGESREPAKTAEPSRPSEPPPPLRLAPTPGLMDLPPLPGEPTQPPGEPPRAPAPVAAAPEAPTDATMPPVLLGPPKVAGAAPQPATEAVATPPPAPAATAPGAGLAAAAPIPAAPAPAAAVAATAAPDAPEAPPAAAAPAIAPNLLAFTAGCLVDPGEGTPFRVTPQIVVVRVRGELLSRVDSLVAQFGRVEVRPEMKRFRGRATDKPFGAAGRRMMRLRGDGALWISPHSRCYTVVDLSDEQVYLREDVLYAFEESLAFENGRVPSNESTDLHLVHLRGRGHALLRSHHPPRAMALAAGTTCRVPLAALLGWHGTIAPRIEILAPEALPDGGGLAAVDLAGEGRVLLDVPT